MVWTFYFDIDLDIDWRTFSQGLINGYKNSNSLKAIFLRLRDDYREKKIS
jgi:hypothetical protein